jgi:hypothetical protein
MLNADNRIDFHPSASTREPPIISPERIVRSEEYGCKSPGFVQPGYARAKQFGTIHSTFEFCVPGTLARRVTREVQK